MMRSLWVAKTGLDAQQTNLDVISNNLANVSTNGFKKQKAVFEDLLYQNYRQPGASTSPQTIVPSGLSLGVGVRPIANVRNFTQGALQQTNNALDLAINGNGFFVINQPDGTQAYTRDGNFQVDNQGQIVTSNGNVLAPGIVLPANTIDTTISSDGIVSVRVAGQVAPQQLGQLQLATFINSAGLLPTGQNLFLETAASGAPQLNTPGQNGAGVLNQRFLEASNVNIAEELVTMIQTQRAYETNAKVISTSDAMLGRLTQL
jgi:flagellar basal-body rod protein FlgG